MVPVDHDGQTRVTLLVNFWAEAVPYLPGLRLGSPAEVAKTYAQFGAPDPAFSVPSLVATGPEARPAAARGRWEALPLLSPAATAFHYDSLDNAGPSFPCDFCSLRYGSRWQLGRHRAKDHGVDPDTSERVAIPAQVLFCPVTAAANPAEAAVSVEVRFPVATEELARIGWAVLGDSAGALSHPALYSYVRLQFSELAYGGWLDVDDLGDGNLVYVSREASVHLCLGEAGGDRERIEGAARNDSPWATLPEEVLVRVLGHLFGADETSLCHARLVCAAWAAAVDSRALAASVVDGLLPPSCQLRPDIAEAVAAASRGQLIALARRLVLVSSGGQTAAALALTATVGSHPAEARLDILGAAVDLLAGLGSGGEDGDAVLRAELCLARASLVAAQGRDDGDRRSAVEAVRAEAEAAATVLAGRPDRARAAWRTVARLTPNAEVLTVGSLLARAHAFRPLAKLNEALAEAAGIDPADARTCATCGAPYGSSDDVAGACLVAHHGTVVEVTVATVPSLAMTASRRHDLWTLTSHTLPPGEAAPPFPARDRVWSCCLAPPDAEACSAGWHRNVEYCL